MSCSYRLRCCIAPEHSETIVSLFYEHETLGCEENRDDNDTIMCAFFSTLQQAQAARLSAGRFDFVESATIETVENRDWMAAWRESMQPAQLAPGFWASPGWLAPPEQHTEYWIKIEPKMAFGTGHHETTRLAAQALISVCCESSIPANVLDIGAGSGILCFVADCCPVARTVGIEIDTSCRNNIAENLNNNPPRTAVHFAIASPAAIKQNATFDIIAMNMLSQYSIPLLHPAAMLLNAGGKLIWSGLLVEEKKDIMAAANSEGFNLLSDAHDGAWWCGIFIKSGTCD